MTFSYMLEHMLHVKMYLCLCATHIICALANDGYARMCMSVIIFGALVTLNTLWRNARMHLCWRHFAQSLNGEYLITTAPHETIYVSSLVHRIIQ